MLQMSVRPGDLLDFTPSEVAELNLYLDALETHGEP